MWPSLDRARRRLSGTGNESGLVPDDAGPTVAPALPGVVEVPAPPLVEDVVIVLGRIEVDQLRAALQQQLGNSVERPDTPARIECALALLLARRGLPGRPTVMRRPAGLSSPEYWEIHLYGVEPATGTAVRDAGRSGRFAA